MENDLAEYQTSEMDFDPHSVKWQCCCCSLPSGMRLLASVEFAFCAITASITMYNITKAQPQDIAASEVCLVGLMLFFTITSIMLIIGIQKHSIQLIYPSLLSRGLAILFLAVFGVSAVFAHNSKMKRGELAAAEDPNVAFKLVLCVFALLFLTVLIFYCCYLVVRLIHYEQSFARLKERRSSLIQAGMIDPDYPSPNNYAAVSRRASSA
ncbi:unnamed protein product [Caenorhabditis angaria]|uniref:DUF7027 domain-containing protein n=1 Tax=Caenorhabditis angaria TaxID=860376 RepID=A0A9P1I8B1_9PELO|nr:unnamed protein product [Caenorhabditis angaria]